MIYAGPQDPDEVVFRVLLFKVFNRIETWELLCQRLGAMPSWDGYGFAATTRSSVRRCGRGERIYSAAYIVPNPPFGEARKHGNHLRLIEHAMTRAARAGRRRGRPARAVRAAARAAVPRPFLAYQYAVDLAYSPVHAARMSRSSSSPGRGALDGISKCFTDTGGPDPAEVIAWMRDTSREHFDRLGLGFADLWGRWPTLIDWQNVFCEVSKYTRATHPHIPGSVWADADQAGVPADPGADRLPVPAEMGAAGRADGPGPPGTGPVKDRVLCRRSPTRTPPPLAHTARRQLRPVVMACAHSPGVFSDTSSA